MDHLIASKTHDIQWHKAHDNNEVKSKQTLNVFLTFTLIKLSPGMIMAYGSRRSWNGSVDPLTSISSAITSSALYCGMFWSIPSFTKLQEEM